MLKSIFVATYLGVVANFGVIAYAEATPNSGDSVDHSASVEAKWQPEDGDVIAYTVLRKGKTFGKHSVRFTKENDTLVATTDVSLKAGLGPITVFSYTLNATETWKNGKLHALSGRVSDDGKDGSVKAVRENGVLVVDGTKFEGDAPKGIVPSSHWNFAQTQSTQLLSTEDGELLDISVTELGRETVDIDGQRVETTRYLMDSDIDVELWYDDDGRWVKLAFEARGQSIEYVLDKLY